MPYLEGTSNIQKLIVVLFVTAIVLSCISLIGMMVEKPDRVYTYCERSGFNSMKPVHLNFSNISEGGTGIPLIQNCTTTVNPPMSSGLSLLINLTTVSAGAFIAVAAIAYTRRKKDEHEVDEPDTPPKQ